MSDLKRAVTLAQIKLTEADVEIRTAMHDLLTELAAKDARITELEAELAAATTVKIASAEINAMSPHVRGYIAALETACDPSGTISENYVVREENRGLRIECQNLATELIAANIRIEESEEKMHYANGTCDLAIKHRDSAESALSTSIEQGKILGNEVQVLREALEFYSNERGWHTSHVAGPFAPTPGPVLKDRGAKARAALAQTTSTAPPAPPPPSPTDQGPRP